MIQLLRRPSRYVQVGALCALLNNAIVIAMDRAGYHYVLGVTVGFIIVMLVSYLLHTTYTFETRGSAAGWLRFAGANVSGFPLSLGSMFVLCDGIGLSASFAMPIATVLLLCWNYFLAYWLIARPSDVRN
jgi:putative flippase GtrA